MLHSPLVILVLVWIPPSLATEMIPCFSFKGEGYMYFKPNINITHSAHYKLEFSTQEENGIIFYAEGDHDYETLYLKKGKLYYLLFNPTDYGYGNSFGALEKTNKKIVKAGAPEKFHKVEFFRNREFKENTKMVLKTGMIVDGQEYSDTGERRNVVMSSYVYLAGLRPSVNTSIPKFTGKIRNFQEMRNHYMLKIPTFSINVEQCSTDQQI